MDALTVARDAEGFLVDRADWSPEFAEAVAADEGVEYSDDFVAVITWARSYYDEYAVVPTVREFTKDYCKGKSRKEAKDLLASLTLGAGMKRIAKAAGLPKPTGCV